MKICWNNIEDLKLRKNGKFGKYFYIESCLCCGDPFLATTITDRFCSLKCSKSKKFLPITSHETKDKIRLSKIGKKNPAWKCGKDLTWYDTYAHRISYAEEIRRAPDNENILEVKCKYCGKWFKPNSRQTKNRINGLNGKINSEYLFYCSQECKNSCPIYKKVKHFNNIKEDTSYEVHPELRKIVLNRDDYTCQKCGKNKNKEKVELHCHHINPVKLDPLESADIDNCITLCKDCHHEAHKKDGCRYGQLAQCSNL